MSDFSDEELSKFLTEVGKQVREAADEFDGDKFSDKLYERLGIKRGESDE